MLQPLNLRPELYKHESFGPPRPSLSPPFEERQGFREGCVADRHRDGSAAHRERHVIDHNQLKDEELRAALARSKPQYTAAETVQQALDYRLVDPSPLRKPRRTPSAEPTEASAGNAQFNEMVLF